MGCNNKPSSGIPAYVLAVLNVDDSFCSTITIGSHASGGIASNLDLTGNLNMHKFEQGVIHHSINTFESRYLEINRSIETHGEISIIRHKSSSFMPQLPQRRVSFTNKVKKLSDSQKSECYSSQSSSKHEKFSKKDCNWNQPYHKEPFHLERFKSIKSKTASLQTKLCSIPQLPQRRGSFCINRSA